VSCIYELNALLSVLQKYVYLFEGFGFTRVRAVSLSYYNRMYAVVAAIPDAAYQP
jgi:hypothetical protein